MNNDITVSKVESWLAISVEKAKAKRGVQVLTSNVFCYLAISELVQTKNIRFELFNF